jgi:membrane-associated PAP2 superfamily phosphatase
MVQGDHFASDVLWSLGFVYLTGLALSYLILTDSQGGRVNPG